MRYVFMLAVSERIPGSKTLPSVHMHEVREVASNVEEAERKIKARYQTNKRFKLEDIRFLGTAG